jgi:hypothetical protein
MLLIFFFFNFGNICIKIILVTNYKVFSLKVKGGQDHIFPLRPHHSFQAVLMVSGRLLYGTCQICDARKSDVHVLHGLKMTWTATARIFEVMHAVFLHVGGMLYWWEVPHKYRQLTCLRTELSPS